MKRYLFTLLLAGLAMFTACTDDRDSNPTVQQPSTFELNMPALGGGVYDLANTDSIRLTYEQPDYGLYGSRQVLCADFCLRYLE